MSRGGPGPARGSGPGSRPSADRLVEGVEAQRPGSVYSTGPNVQQIVINGAGGRGRRHTCRSDPPPGLPDLRCLASPLVRAELRGVAGRGYGSWSWPSGNGPTGTDRARALTRQRRAGPPDGGTGDTSARRVPAGPVSTLWRWGAAAHSGSRATAPTAVPSRRNRHPHFSADHAIRDRGYQRGCGDHAIRDHLLMGAGSACVGGGGHELHDHRPGLPPARGHRLGLPSRVAWAFTGNRTRSQAPSRERPQRD